jgi:hypothetical protein
MLIGNQLPAHRRVEQDMHQGFEMGFALRCQIEFFQPIFEQQRFDILNRKIPRFGSAWFFSQQQYLDAVEYRSGSSSARYRRMSAPKETGSPSVCLSFIEST